MNLPLLFFLLSFLRSTGWCRALGNSGSPCPEESCFSSNRETCSFGSSECGSCYQGFIEVGGECIPIESNSNDDAWESELEGTDGSDLKALFETPITPTENPRKTEKYQHSSPPFSDFPTPSAPATAVEENTNELNNKDDHLGSKVATKDVEKSERQLTDETKADHSDLKTKSLNTRERENKLKKDLKLSKKGELGLLREKQKKLDEDKLNNFLSKKQQNKDDGKELNDKIVSSEDGMNLESNSSTNPPPFIRKHKVGKPEDSKASEMDDIYFLFIVIGCSVAGIAGLGLAGYCWYKLHTTAKAVSEAEYSGYGKGPSKRPPSLHGDEKLDYNAEMYHYHQTKSQLTAMEKAGSKTSKQGSMEDDENSDEGDEGDYTVYECPGLAPTGDMTVVNPLFSDQEAVGSDQDANGNRSGQSSPSSSRHSSTVKPAE